MWVSLLLPPALNITLIRRSQIFKRLSKQLNAMNTIELQYVSPRLLKVRDLELAIPGEHMSCLPLHPRLYD